MKVRRSIPYIFLIAMALQISSCTSLRLAPPWKQEVVIFYPGKDIPRYMACWYDIESYKEIAMELGLNRSVVDYRFINRTELFFDKDGQRKFEVLILPGGEPVRWFKHKTGTGINCQGVKNILKFIESGGSVIAICMSGSTLFSWYFDWLGPNLREAQSDFDGKWKLQHRMRNGYFLRFCGVYAFDGTIRGPQETNRPYPIARFLPIRMNLKNEMVREANLPSVIHMIVSGGGSIIPSESQPLDVVGWYPNGTVAIGIVPYGQGRIILSNPHPNITGERAWIWRTRGIMSDWYQTKWGWTQKMRAEGWKLIKNDKDPDGPRPDWALAKAMLSYAYKKASE